MPKPLIIVLIGLMGVAFFEPTATAQMRAPAMAVWGQAPASFPSALGTAGALPPPHSVGGSFAGRPPSHPVGPAAILLGSPFLYADYPTQPWAVQPPPPQVVIVQPASAAAAPPEAKSEPLLIELQGNRYVRFGGRQQSAERGMNAPPDFAEAEPHASPQITQRPTQPELPPAILIFRDGHREQAAEYAIVGGTLYATGDYWQSGHWTRNIQLSMLDLPATIQANHDAGIKFTLPSAPNDVVTRP
jgi:hypothetical protein